jgi:S-DNA-T family DNA segregation ATPase FtsK/SpoIIIE
VSEEKKKRTGEPRAERAKDSKNTQNTEHTAGNKRKKQAEDTENAREEEKTNSRKKNTQKEQEEAQVPPHEPPKEDKEPDPSSVGNQLAVLLLGVVALFIGICYGFRDDVGIIGYAINQVLFGLFGIGAFLVPFLLVQLAVFWRKDVLSGAVKHKYLVSLSVLLFSAVILHTIYCIIADVPKMTIQMVFSLENLKGLFVKGVEYKGGGFLGGLLASSMICAVGYPGTVMFGSLFLIGFVMSLFGLTPMECIQRYRFYMKRSRSAQEIKREERNAKREERAKKEAEEEKSSSEPEKKPVVRKKKRADDIDREIFADYVDFGTDADRPIVQEEELRPISVIEKEEREEKVNLGDIFDKKTDEAVLSRYADADARETDADDSHTSAQMELNVKKETPSAKAEPLDDDDDMQYFVPIKKIKTESTKTVEKVTSEPIREAIPAAKKTAKPTPVPKEEAPAVKEEEPKSDVISIRPPEMSVPAPSAEEDDETVDLPKPREYEFPPIELLAKPDGLGKDGDVSAELRENADKIIQTLESFNVRVSISNVSRGPTITRYEIEPSAGTRVRSILNLLDDIALSLATTGVRSDGIISGKSAIGIEVPNKKTNTVFVRELIEDSRFETAKSKLTASLGMDVSGAPVYLDVAKMPHLLIAGATGQGKSVCINSLIISLLYKARPDEVKFILIDPKKVELNVYNGLPHLLVPVVFDPKKAAGSLHWAVQEMERRFELIEAQHVRNIAQYNAAIADDPTKEKMPQVVIIIDELADLMMSAPDDVETSICRLAQKARAAGMHLIIGTQRPSTDVITGLIKANIPSRIAFTVSNQIDSRIIIDMQGAEKLIGRGDMLFSPVGSSKPVRVQGAFVSEVEIENIIDFIKEQSKEPTYSDEVIKEIEKNAAICGQKKNKSASAPSENGIDGEEDVDPMFDSAVELAVEQGKISTSLIQRRLSLGYGRAAKLIDMMEKRGIVSPPDGPRPRTTLISREQYLEMRMNHIDSEAVPTDDEPPFDI